MEKVLVIDHKVGGSYFVPYLVPILQDNGLTIEIKQHTELDNTTLDKVKDKDYTAVISASGFCRIRGNEELNAENDLIDICEEQRTPTFLFPHASQIRAVHLFGDDAIAEAEDGFERTGVHDDYHLETGAWDDPIFKGINEKLSSKEYHKYDIIKMERPYKVLVEDLFGFTILAAHENSEVISYLTQMHPEYNPKPGEKVNSLQLLINFINMAKKRK